MANRLVLADRRCGGSGVADAGAAVAEHLREGLVVKLDQVALVAPLPSHECEWCWNSCETTTTPHCRPWRAIIWKMPFEVIGGRLIMPSQGFVLSTYWGLRSVL